jgi:hypothetical protein
MEGTVTDRHVLHRVIRKVPDAFESFQEPAAKLLTDRHHGVLLTGIALMTEICAVEPAVIEAYRRHVPQLCNIMRSLLMSGFAPEHDVSGITDPFLQVKVSSARWSRPKSLLLHAGIQAAACSRALLVC